MSENTLSVNLPAEPEIPSTRGMTTKVVKGSLWTLGGQILPLLASLVSTPFIIRFLGSEGYGVLILVALIPAYFSFADFGMGIGSTKFGSESYSLGLRKQEAEVVRTAGVFAFLSSLVFAIPLFVFSHWITAVWFRVPESYQQSASIGLKITSVSFVLTILAQVFNTPLLSRLRMDLNTLVNAAPKILMNIVTPLVLFLGGRVVEAVWMTFIAITIGFLGTIYFSGRLLPELYGTTINTKFLRPLWRFGSAWVVASVAGVLLMHLDKFFLTRFVSVESLAFYSVAFTFASMATMFSGSMLQSLVPAFSQLSAPEKKTELDALFARGIRLNLILLLPAVMILFVIAKPFFTFWAGEQFGVRSSPLFYVMILGVFFNILAYIPHSAITASGRTDIFAKLYWAELAFYGFAAYWLVDSYETEGAAIAWTLRTTIDAFLIVWLSKKVAGVSFGIFKHFASLLFGAVLLTPPVLFAVFYNNFSLWLIPLTLLSGLFYVLLIWSKFIDDDERRWIRRKIENFLNRKSSDSATTV